jgi:hypothetical protein
MNQNIPIELMTNLVFFEQRAQDMKVFESTFIPKFGYIDLL